MKWPIAWPTSTNAARAMTVPLPTSVQIAGAAEKKTAKKNTTTVMPAICEIGLARRLARPGKKCCTATPRPNGSRSVMKVSVATDAAGICSGRLKTSPSISIATGTRTTASTPAATSKPIAYDAAAPAFINFVGNMGMIGETDSATRAIFTAGSRSKIDTTAIANMGMSTPIARIARTSAPGLRSK